MKLIPLTQGYQAFVDDEDYKELSKHRWYYHDGYADSTKGKMHRIIMAAKKGAEVDHVNRNKLDNRKSNLRIATRSQNNHNVGLRKDNTSGQKGVSYFKPRNSWVARIQIEGKRFYLGSFKNRDQAIIASQEAQMAYKIDTIRT